MASNVMNSTLSLPPPKVFYSTHSHHYSLGSVCFSSSRFPLRLPTGTWPGARGEELQNQRQLFRSLFPRASSGNIGAQDTVDFPLNLAEEEEVGENVVPAPAPTAGRIDIVVDKNAIRQLDLSAAHAVLDKFVRQVGDNIAVSSSDPRELFGRPVGFVLKYERDDPFDPRELSELPDIRLWFVRLDATYPWLPIILDWRGGELARYAAMVVPHQMSRRSGLVFNPEALELFAMNKVFLLYPWLKSVGVLKPSSKLNDMLHMLGFTVSNELYSLIERHPPP